LAIRAEHAAALDRTVHIADVGPGAEEAVLAGRAVRVRWGLGREGLSQAEAFDVGALHFPLLVRARAPGDRIRLPGGTRKVKELLLERRIPSARRAGLALVTDAVGDVLWIPNVARSALAAAGEGGTQRCWIEIA
jgi:tRNA(Ile)-lysidine synthetase-like protein